MSVSICDTGCGYLEEVLVKQLIKILDVQAASYEIGTAVLDCRSDIQPSIEDLIALIKFFTENTTKAKELPTQDEDEVLETLKEGKIESDKNNSLHVLNDRRKDQRLRMIMSFAIRLLINFCGSKDDSYALKDENFITKYSKGSEN